MLCSRVVQNVRNYRDYEGRTLLELRSDELQKKKKTMDTEKETSRLKLIRRAANQSWFFGNYKKTEKTSG